MEAWRRKHGKTDLFFKEKPDRKGDFPIAMRVTRRGSGKR
jgi:hypothetical protein